MNIQTIRNIIRMDLIALKHGKSGLKTILILLVLLFGTAGVIAHPLVGLYCPLLWGGCFGGAVLNNEVKYHSEKLPALLPVSRKELVQARFLFVTGSYVLVSVLFYLLMRFSCAINEAIYKKLFSESSYMDILSLLANASGNLFSKTGILNLCYIAAFAIGFTVAVYSLRNHFHDPYVDKFELHSDKSKKRNRQGFRTMLILAPFFVLYLLIVTGTIAMPGILMTLLSLLLQIAGAANGALLAFLIAAWAVFCGSYMYICTLLDYEQKEL